MNGRTYARTLHIHVYMHTLTSKHTAHTSHAHTSHAYTSLTVTRTYTHTCTHTHTHTHTHTQVAIADHSGVLTCFGMKRGDANVSIHVQTFGTGLWQDHGCINDFLSLSTCLLLSTLICSGLESQAVYSHDCSDIMYSLL